MGDNREEGRREPYLGVLEITLECISLSPAPADPEVRRRILWDFISQEAPGDPWHVVGMPLNPDPTEMLAAVAPRIFGDLLQDGNDSCERELMAAPTDSSGSGVTYVVGITPIPNTTFNFRLCHVQLLAVRKGDTWRDPQGQPLSDEERAAAVQPVLDEIRANHQETLRRG